jgi:lysophospholipase L1-like esterase
LRHSAAASALTIRLRCSDVRLAKKQRHIAVVNRGLFELAVEAEVVFVDLHPVFADENGHLRRDLTSGDGLHLNDLGNDLYARSMAR